MMTNTDGPATGTPAEPATGTTVPPPATGPTPETPPATGTAAGPPATGAEGPDLAAEVERYRAEARKWEDRSKANASAARELDALRLQSMTDTERAVAEAVASTRQNVRVEFGARLVDAEVRAAAAGSAVDVDVLLEGLDRRRFLNEDGEPNVREIRRWVGRVAPKAPEPGPPGLDLGQGQRPGPAGAPDMNSILRSAAGLRTT